jgi:hypothetical protein
MRLLVALAFVALSSISAEAASTAKLDLTGARCEMPEITAVIRKAVRNMRLEDGTSLLNYMGNNSDLKATTISSSRDQLVCRVKVNFRIRGTQVDINGRYVFRAVAGGKITQEFDADY